VAPFVAGRSLEAIVEPYFDEVLAAARSGLFDVLGHLDFVKRYLHPHVTAKDLAGAPELYEPILRALVDSGTGLEVNTSGLRQAAHETYPSAAIVARYRELGGERLTIGSDAHRAHAFAWGLADGYAHALAAGFESMTFRRGGDPVAVPLAPAPNAIAVRSL
jgi:histidinol-phosphatase (PHP family)